jgi:hypothetical protein
LSKDKLQKIMAEPAEERQNWLMNYLKEVLLMFSHEDQQFTLAAPKEQQFFVMKSVYQRLAREATGGVGDTGQGGSV